MIVKGALFSLSLLLNTAVEPYQPPLDAEAARTQMTPQQKNAAIQPLMRSATDCVVQAVAANPTFQAGMKASAINDLIVASMEPCVDKMHALIEAHDHLFGEGSGEAFFMGPYLAILPRAVTRQVKGTPLP